MIEMVDGRIKKGIILISEGCWWNSRMMIRRKKMEVGVMWISFRSC